MLPFERFEAWKACHRPVLGVYDATSKYPREELYGLSSQSRRAAFSAVANIAEGSAKRGRKEFGRYLDIAIGSLSELACALMVARDRGMLKQVEWEALEHLRARAGLLTWKLYRSVRP